MHDALLIVKREFRERVASKSFVVGTLLFPVFLISLLLLPRLVGGSSAEWTLVLVNEAPADLGSAEIGRASCRERV